MKGLVSIPKPLPAEHVFNTGVPMGKSASMVFRTGIRYDRLDKSSNIDAADQTIHVKEIVQYCSTYEKISIPDYCGVPI